MPLCFSPFAPEKKMSRYVILGTAGHIDHGKSTLVKAMTGVDPDRLKEEKERGITIDLGFADISYPDGLRVGIVDVPGHERLIKNMLAGAGGIDILLMVIAADEGIMPQSREHLDICNILKIQRGIVVLTKADLVDAEWLELMRDDIKAFTRGTFLEDADIVEVSSTTGSNIDILKEKIRELATDVQPKSESGVFRLPVDRVFTLKGFGTVVTGTAISGSISVDKTVEILPGGLTTKVRGLQSHGQTMKTAYAGQRVAINLQGISKDEINRGDVITIPDKLKTSYFIDVELELLKNTVIGSLKSRSLVHFHTGTTELVGRIVIYGRDELMPGEKAYCQIRFKEPVTVMSGDRYIIRKFSPLLTIGGGEILDTSPKRRNRDERLKDLEVFDVGVLEDKISAKVLQNGLTGSDLAEISGWIKSDTPEVQRAISSLLKRGEMIKCEGRYLHRDRVRQFNEKLTATLEDFHKQNPLKAGMQKETLRGVFKGCGQKVFEALIVMVEEVLVERDNVKLSSFTIALGEDKTQIKKKIFSTLDAAAFQPPSRDELATLVAIKPGEVGEILKLMAVENTLVRINDSLYISKANHGKMISDLQKFFDHKAEMTVGEFRDVLATSRKFAIPFLEYLDSNKITLRVGEVRKFIYKSLPGQ